MIARLVVGFCGLLWIAAAAAQSCGTAPVQVQVLGSGGPELADHRAASGYLVWVDGKARVLVDIGGGAALRFGESGATVSDLDVILLTDLHADHTADLPALIQSSSFGGRTQPLPVYGPAGNKSMPSTVTFVRTLFDSTRGAYRHLGDFLNPLTRDTYKLQPHDVGERDKIRLPRKTGGRSRTVFTNDRLQATARAVLRAPALAWRVEAHGKSIVFSGDANGEGGGLEQLAAGADLMVVHNAVPESAVEVARIAHDAGVKQLVLSQRTRRTLGRETETLDLIKKRYTGPVEFANDLDCFTP